MIERKQYLSQLIKGKGLNLIKVITGVRRCGKSTLLKQYKDYLTENGILEKDIIYMNFESALWYDIKDYKDLYQYVTKNKGKNKLYILLDEVQNVLEWERAVNSFLVDIDCDIYITGSNAYLLSSELTTLLAGRVLTIKIYPFSFKEYLSTYPFDSKFDNYQKFDQYLKYGGMPMLVNMRDDEELIFNYLNDLRNVVIMKDVISRNHIKDAVFLDNLVKYMASVIGNLVSANSISEYLRKNGNSIHNETIESYLNMLENAYLIYRVPRFELHGKQLLKTQGKYYFVDNGIKNVISGLSHYDSGSSYENIVYIELLRRGYDVYVGKYKDLEIDFVAVKPEETIYVQVSRSILDEEVEEREKKSLLAIKDNYPKIILTMDKNYHKQLEGIRVINIVDWLLGL